MTGFEPEVPPQQPDPVWIPPAPSPPSPKRQLWRPLGALLCFAAAILTLFGSFLSLFTYRIEGAGVGGNVVLTVSSWSVRLTNNGTPAPIVPAGLAANNGPPLVFAATAMLAAAVLGLLAAAAPGSVAITRSGTLTAVGATAFLAGTTWTITMEQLSLLDRFNPPGPEGVVARIDYSTTLDLGYWLLVTASAVAIAGAVFAFLPLGRRLRPRSEPDTPPLGIQMGAIVHRLPDEPPDEPE